MVTIKDISGNSLISTIANSGSIYKATIMSEEYVTIKFTTSSVINFKRGSYIELTGEEYEVQGISFGLFEIIDKQHPTYNNTTGGYDYELRFDAPYWKFKHKILFYDRSAGHEKEWSLTAKASRHLDIVISNISALGYKYGGIPYSYVIDETVVGTEAKYLSYDATNIINALNNIADEWECEWWFEGSVLHLGKYEVGESVLLKEGDNLSTITRNDSSSAYATRIYAFGSTKNITSYYGKTLTFTIGSINGIGGGLVHGVNVGSEMLGVKCFSDVSSDKSMAYIDILFLTGKNTGKACRAVYYISTDGTLTTDEGEFKFITDYSYDNYQSAVDVDVEVGNRFTALNGIVLRHVPSIYFSAGTNDSYIESVVTTRLHLPSSTGGYIDAEENLSTEDVVDDIVIFEEIYPRTVCTVDKLDTIARKLETTESDGTTTVGTFLAYQLHSNTLADFTKDYILSGETLSIKMTSGQLNGKSFEVTLYSAGDINGQSLYNVFEIVRDDEWGINLPCDTMKPSMGDSFVVYGFDTSYVDNSLVAQAENELEVATRKYIAKTKIDPNTYECKVNEYQMSEELNLSPENRTLFLPLGNVVQLEAPTYLTEIRESRIYGFEKQLDGSSITYTIGESPKYSWIAETEDDIEALKYSGSNTSSGGVSASSSGSSISVIKSTDTKAPTDSNVYSSLRVNKQFLKKTEADTASEKITFEKGILIGTKEVTAVKRSSDSDTDVPIDDKSIATPAWVEQNALSKTKEDTAAERITFRKGLTAYSTSTEGAGNGIIEGEESEIIEVDASEFSTTIGGLENVSDEADNASAGSILGFDGAQWAVIPSQADIATDIANMLVPVWHTVLQKMIFVPCSIFGSGQVITNNKFPYTLPLILS